MGYPTWAPTFHALIPGNSGQKRSSTNLQYNTLVPDATRNVFPVEVFEQRNSILSRDSRKFFEYSYRQTGAPRLAVLGQHVAQPCDSSAMKNEILGYLDEHFFAQQDLQDFLRARRFNRQFFEHRGEAGNRKARALEFLFDQFLGVRFFGREGDLPSGALDQV